MSQISNIYYEPCNQPVQMNISFILCFKLTLFFQYKTKFENFSKENTI